MGEGVAILEAFIVSWVSIYAKKDKRKSGVEGSDIGVS